MTDKSKGLPSLTRRGTLAGLAAGGATVAMPGILRAQGETIRIGFPTPLTGPFAAEAKDQVKSAELAVKLINDKGGIAGRKVELLVRDDKLNAGEAATRTLELIEAQQETCQEIEQAKESLEAANDRKKACQSAIDEWHSRLRNLAKELKKPYVYPLPPAPSRQRELPLGDGEEWRLVPLSEVLKDEVAIKATVLEKLGNITLGKYAEEAQKFGLGDKPKKLTRKQWDKVEAIVQRWHEEQHEDEEDEGDEE